MIVPAIEWISWDFDADRPGGPDARAEVDGAVLEAYDDGSWAVDDEISDGARLGDDLEAAKAACVARLIAGPPYGEPLAAVMCPPMFAFGAKRWPGLAKLCEEAGEVQRVIGKLMQTGGAPAYFDGTDLRVRLQDELADLAAAFDFAIMHCDLDEDAVVTRSKAKLEQYEAWHAQACKESP